MIHYNGYIQHPGHERADYLDWVDVVFRDADDVRREIECGNLPPGLVLRDDKGTVAVVGNFRNLRRVTV